MTTKAEVQCSEEYSIDMTDNKAVRKALRRVDAFILLPIIIMFVFLQFDRTVREPSAKQYTPLL